MSGRRPARVASQLVHVGDGLCHRFERIDGWGWPRDALQVDCGSQQGMRRAAERWMASVGVPELYETAAVCVTHYHTDHYNGLVWASRKKTFPRLPLLSEFYHPGTPVPESRELLRATFALFRYTAGATGLPMDLDLWRTVARLSERSHVARHPLYQGDTVVAGGITLDVAWPPADVDDEVRDSIREALEAFYELMASPKRDSLRDLYEQTAAADLFLSPPDGEVQDGVRVYDLEDGGPWEGEGLEDELDSFETDSDISKVNGRLRRAANLLSLAFVADGRILCLGDLEGSSLGHACDYVVEELGRDFVAVVAPHHGTKWHASMDRLRAETLAVPVGPKLWSHVATELGRIASRVRFSQIEGDLWL